MQVILKENVAVPEHIVKFHPLVVQTKQQFPNGQDYKGRIILGEKTLDIYVSRAQASRAFRIMDTVIKELEQHGISVGIDKENDWGQSTYATVDGEKVYFCIEEPLKIIKKEPGRYGFTSQDFVPTGKLGLRIKDQLGGARNNWKDGESSKIEEKLDSFINGLGVAAAYLKKKHLEDEEWRRQWEEKRQAEVRKQQALEEETKCCKTLEEQALSWQKSRTIHDFIQAEITAKGDYVPDSPFGKWVLWAKAYADKLDPLKPASP